MKHRALMSLMLSLVFVPACDDGPAVRDDGRQVIVVDERVEDDEMIRAIELVEPATDELISVAPEPVSACVCTGCNGPCKPGGGACTICWTEGGPPADLNCCETCLGGLPDCPPLLD